MHSSGPQQPTAANWIRCGLLAAEGEYGCPIGDPAGVSPSASPLPLLHTSLMFRRRTVYTLLCLLATVLIGTVVVLSSISYYLYIDEAAYLSEEELAASVKASRPELVPKIIHQTWKSETLPPMWANTSQGCRDMMPDYEYILWTDASAREFIAQNYAWFLDTFDGYTYPIQRADSIRYFVLYHYGGIYMDLDMGCLRPLDPLLLYPVTLAKTIPVGVSNDLIASEKGHPFMAQTIHNLMSFDYSWVLNYPTVMFSTGPMFLSAQYGTYTSSHPLTPSLPGGEVRILPKSLYGKNAKPEEAPHSFFLHYYGSSWHADDAAFIGFLGKWGKGLMWVGLVVLIGGLIRLALVPSPKQRSYGLARIGGYEVMMPRWSQRNGRWYLDLGWFTLPASGVNTQSASPVALSPSADEDEVPLLPVFTSRSASPVPSETSSLSIDSGLTTSHSTAGRSMLDVHALSLPPSATALAGGALFPPRILYALARRRVATLTKRIACAPSWLGGPSARKAAVCRRTRESGLAAGARSPAAWESGQFRIGELGLHSLLTYRLLWLLHSAGADVYQFSNRAKSPPVVVVDVLHVLSLHCTFVVYVPPRARC
ncbi:Mannosyl phosphorylinositol ceramide synthase SUR1 [Grifola frondosa]|uniref:Mannosyl phosphorylinositol ceramide synthase SUR1 n=1 Tax=Grifola frondosa TaxID=5627 RepID=A0A1C7M1Q9_GRIFR|nr:Mannosyl phosphorylinositol ceramide synthase SUR1 [Grifola frondosa]